MDNSGWAAVKGATLRVYPEGEAKAKGLFQAALPAEMKFSKIVEAAGGYGEQLTDPDQVTSAIERCMKAIECGIPALLHVSVTKM